MLRTIIFFSSFQVEERHNNESRVKLKLALASPLAFYMSASIYFLNTVTMNNLNHFNSLHQKSIQSNATRSFYFGSLLLLWLSVCIVANAEETICVYQDVNKKSYEVESIEQVPRRYRYKAECGPTSALDLLASPDEMELGRSVRNARFSSPLGYIEARWPKTVTNMFGRTPNKALLDAAKATAKVLNKGRFPAELRSPDFKLQVVFLDEELPETQIPRTLISNCHPAWMTPPSNVYVVAQRVMRGCGNAPKKRQSIADAELAEVLLHEFGHVVEYHLLKDAFGGDSLRSEGFATWFASYASNYSSEIKRGVVEKKVLDQAKLAIQASPDVFDFDGSGNDYSRAASFFFALESFRGINGILDVYDTMLKENIDFVEAIRAKYHWDLDRLWKESAKVSGL